MRRGDARAVARAITLVENDAPEGQALLQTLHAHTGRAFVIGITGPPGAGKSTLVDALIRHVRPYGLTVGVIAVDPTSPFTGGAILVDDRAVVVQERDAAGKDLVIIETVGVGQGEVEIVRTADIAIVVLVPGAGDDVQAIKAGIMEIADIFVVNKADLDGGDRLAEAVSTSLSLRTFASTDWRPPVVKAEATGTRGISELWDQIGRFRAHPASRQADRRRQRHELRLRELLTLRFLQHVEQELPSGAFEETVDAIAEGRTDPHSAADDLFRRVSDAPRGHHEPGAGGQSRSGENPARRPA